MEQEVLDILNKLIRSEHGKRVNMTSLWMDAEVDSFGTTMVFLEMEDKYPGHFDSEWFATNAVAGFQNMTIRSIVERALDESIKPQDNPA